MNVLLLMLVLGSSLTVQPLSGLAASLYAVRSIEELKLMTEPELAGESRLVCLEIGHNLGEQRYYGESRQPGHANLYFKALEEVRPRQQYLERIGLVVRDRHHGQMPKWFEQMVQAAKSDDLPTAEKACTAAATLGGWHP